MPTTTLTVLPGDDKNKFGFNTEPTQTVNTTRVNQNMDPYGVSTPTTTTGVPDVSAPPAPTMGETLTGIKNEALRIQDILNQRQADEAGSNFATSDFQEGPAFDPYDEEKARRNAIRNQTRLYQSEIDATNQVYDQLLNEARIEGQGRIGSQRAIAARGGLLGSDFAGAQKNRVQNFNTDIQRGIQAERVAAIGAIEGKIRDSVALELQGKREARQLGAEEYTNWLAGKNERKAEYRNQIALDAITQGYDLTALSEEELAELARPAGLKANDLISSYLQLKAQQEAAGAEADLETRKTEAEIRKIEADIASGKLIKMGEGDMLYDPATRETFKNPKTSIPGGGSTPGVDKIYTEKNLPGDVRSDLVDDIMNSSMAKDGTLTVQQLMFSYPEVNLETIQSFYDQFYTPPPEPKGGADGNIWTFWD